MDRLVRKKENTNTATGTTQRLPTFGVKSGVECIFVRERKKQTRNLKKSPEEGKGNFRQKVSTQKHPTFPFPDYGYGYMAMTFYIHFFISLMVSRKKEKEKSCHFPQP